MTISIHPHRSPKTLTYSLVALMLGACTSGGEDGQMVSTSVVPGSSASSTSSTSPSDGTTAPSTPTTVPTPGVSTNAGNPSPANPTPTTTAMPTVAAPSQTPTQTPALPTEEPDPEPDTSAEPSTTASEDVEMGGAGGMSEEPASTGGGGSGEMMPPDTGGGLAGYNPDFKEFAGEDCDLPEPMLLSPASHMLPDPFLMPDGTRMSSASQWACQRAWLKKNLGAFVHGEKPPTPEVVTGSVSSSGVSIHVEDGGKSADFMIPIDLPSGASGPVPAMFMADGSGVPANFIQAEGVATMSYSHSTAESAFNTIYGGGGVADPIKWAWAVSRAIDVMVSERDAGNNDIIDPTALGTTGCSYAGKSAFIVGAYDERIALGLPMESGTGGLGSYRVVADKDLGPNGGEDPEQVNEACNQGWLTGEVCSGSVDDIPADAHFLVAMYAPRGFTTVDNNRIGHLGPVAQFTAASAGAEVFKALGVESHVGYHGGNDDDPHNHCSFNQSQEETVLKAIHGFLTKTEPPANFMEPKLKNQSDQPVDYDLGKYVDWETPMLSE